MGIDEPRPHDKTTTGDNAFRIQTSWSDDEVSEDGWSSRVVGFRTPAVRGVINPKPDKNTNISNKKQLENQTDPDNCSKSVVSNSKTTSEKNHKNQKLKYLSKTPSTPVESRTLPNTLSRDRTFCSLNQLTEQTTPTRHWASSFSPLSRQNTTFSLSDVSRNSSSHSGSRIWEGSKTDNRFLERQKTVIQNAQPLKQKFSHVTTGFCLGRSKTLALIASKEHPKRDPNSLHLSTSMTISRLNTSVSDLDLSKRTSRLKMQEDQEPTQVDLEGTHPKLDEKKDFLGQSGPKFEYKVPKAMLPKKGLIKLTALVDEQTNPALYDEYLQDKDKESVTSHHHTSYFNKLGRKVRPAPLSHKKLMVKQKHFMSHLDQEQTVPQDWKEEVQTKHYTFADLQKGLLNFDVGSTLTPGKKRPLGGEFTEDESGDTTAQLPPLDITNPKDSMLPPLRT